MTPWQRFDLMSGLILAAVLAAGLIIFALHHLNDPNIWFDESGQYWLSRGLSHDSAFDEGGQSIFQGIWNGMTGFNLDPPGFTFNLGIWVLVFGSSSISIRSLPFLMLVGSFVLAYLIGRRHIGLSHTLSVALPALMLTTATPLFYSTEIRAYSSELFAVTLLAYTFPFLLRSNRASAALPYLLALAFGMLATRYFFAVGFIATAIVYLFTVLMQRNFKSRLKQLLTTGLGYMLIALATAFSIGLIGGGEQWGYGKGYSQQGVSLRNSENVWELIQLNLWRDEQRVTGLFLILGLTAVLLMGALFRTKLQSSWTRSWVVVWVFVVAYELVAATLSIAMDAPWNIGDRWSIGLWAIATLSLLGLAGMVLDALRHFLPSSSQWIIPVLSIAVAIPIVFTSFNRLADYQRPVFRLAGSELPALVSGVIPRDVDVQWAIDYWSWPTFRWLVKESGEWPADLAVTNALPVGDGVLTNANWPEVIPTLQLCAPGKWTVVFHERWNSAFGPRTQEIKRFATQQRCTVDTFPIGSSEIMLVIKPAFE